MRISVILAHPSAGSFNHAIAETAVRVLTASGHDLVFHDLYREKFDPVLTAGEMEHGPDEGSLVALHCWETVRANGIVIIHPNWWGQPPAILKGWIDRVLRPGVAYRFEENDRGEGVPVGLLKARAALIFNTSNTPEVRENAVFGDPLEGLWRRCIFELCGVPSVRRIVYRVVVTSTQAQRKAWLDEAAASVREYFREGSIS
ncbi:MAG: NAD(P)H-dependent oxidoreductase [Candidatus Omnitrophota bacterium]